MSRVINRLVHRQPEVVRQSKRTVAPRATVPMLRCVNPCTSPDPDENPSRCRCGGETFWFTDPKGIEEPELVCIDCTAFAPVA
jgi:hypothetical protein